VHPFDLFSCCPGEHTLEEGCLAREFTCPAGVHREVVGIDGDDPLIKTTGPSGSVGHWSTTRAKWRDLRGVHRQKGDPR